MISATSTTHRPFFETTDSPSGSRRRGTTLTEVLMALMVMSIGVISLATLFPISALRVVEATHMTNSTILRHQAEGLMDAASAMAFDPDGDGNSAEHSQTTYVIDPLGIWNLRTQTSVPLTDVSLRRFEYNRPGGITQPPLSRQTRFLGESTASPRVFTNLDLVRELTSLQDTTTQVVEGTATAFTANSVTFPTTDGMDAMSATISSALTITPTPPSDIGWRVTLFDVSGRLSEVKTVSVDSANTSGSSTVEFDEPLSSELQAIGVGLARLEIADDFYTFMYSVRNTAGTFNFDVVVFFKRDFSELSQQLYIGDLRRFNLGTPAAPGLSGVDDNGDGVTDDIREIGSVGIFNAERDTENSSVVVDWNPALYTTVPEKPPIRRGGYVYDTVNGLWYRIQSIGTADADGDGIIDDTAATLNLDSAIHRDNTEDLDDSGAVDLPGEDRNSDGIVDRGGLIIPRGVIAVFPLRARRLD